MLSNGRLLQLVTGLIKPGNRRLPVDAPEHRLSSGISRQFISDFGGYSEDTGSTPQFHCSSSSLLSYCTEVLAVAKLFLNMAVHVFVQVTAPNTVTYQFLTADWQVVYGPGLALVFFRQAV